MNTIKHFIKDEQGLETVEYAVMTALIVTGVVVAIWALRDAIAAKFTQVTGVVAGS
jgi:Flp pilus assembly pilin Flp